MDNIISDTQVLIIGAGISGLMAARVLQDRGIDTLIVEKNTTVGGRLNTVQLQSGVADVGAQYFVARSETFQALVDHWLDEHLIYVWSNSTWHRASLVQETTNHQPVYAAHGGMQSLAYHISYDFDVRTGIRIISVTSDGNRWLAQDEDGRVITANALLITTPIPITLQMLSMGGTELSESDNSSLQSIRYAGNFSAVFLIDGKMTLPKPGAIQNPYDSIYWIVDNKRKGISGQMLTATLLTRPEYTMERWDESDEEILAAMQHRLRPYLSRDTKIIESQLKRWSHAIPITLYHDRYLIADAAPPLIFAGDAFGEPLIEGATLSGMAAGEAIANLLG